MLLRVFSKLDRYFLEKGDNYRKPLISTMFITLYDHIWISLYLKSILLKNVYWPLTIIFSDQKLHSKKYLMCKILSRPCYIFPYLKTKLVNTVLKLKMWYQFQDRISLLLDPVWLRRSQRGKEFAKEHFYNVYCHNLYNFWEFFFCPGWKTSL